ncbi:MAG: DUF2924 domain-containing protein [Nitratireductor sp.]
MKPITTARTAKSNLDQNTNLAIDQCVSLNREELIALWVKQYKRPPPKGIKRGLLERSAGYNLQARKQGKLRSKTQKALLAIALNNRVEQDVLPSPKITVKAGTKLVREWQGRTYTVHVIENGFVLNEVRYKSLSAIAKVITGAKWSGPRFFGIRS